MNENDSIIYLNDEGGNEVAFEFVDLVEYSGEEYVVLLPKDELDDEAGEVVILRVDETDEDEESYVSVEDEDELNQVFQVFKDRCKDKFDFVE